MEQNQPIQNPEPIKKEKKGCPLAIVIILAILAIGGTGFGVYELLRSDTEVNCLSNTLETNQDAKEENTQNQPTQESTPEISPSQAIYDENDFTIYPRLLSPDGSYYNKYTHTVEFYNPSAPSQIYTIKCNRSSCKIYKDNEEFASVTGFSGEIKQYYLGKFGQAVGNEQLLFVMDNGNVENIPLYQALQNNNFTPTVMDDLKDIVAIYQVTSTPISEDGQTVGGSGVTMLAEDRDGNYHDLSNYLNA